MRGIKEERDILPKGIHLKLLKWAVKQSEDGFHFDDWYDEAHRIGFLTVYERDAFKDTEKIKELEKAKNEDEKARRTLGKKVFLRQFFDSVTLGEGHIHRVNTEGFFHYLEFVELEEARKDSRTARSFSWFAIIVSIIGVMLSIWLTSTVRLDEDQFQLLREEIGQLAEENRE